MHSTLGISLGRKWRKAGMCRDDVEELVESAQNGDLEALDALLRLHESSLLKLCYWLTGNHREDALDMAQDALFRACKSLQGFRGDCAFGAWLTSIAFNVAKERWKRSSDKPPPLSLDQPITLDDNVTLKDTLASTEPCLDDVTAEREIIRAAIQMLPEDDIGLFIQRELEELSYQEIADQRGTSVEEVKARIGTMQRRLKKIAEELQ